MDAICLPCACFPYDLEYAITLFLKTDGQQKLEDDESSSG